MSGGQGQGARYLSIFLLVSETVGPFGIWAKMEVPPALGLFVVGSGGEQPSQLELEEYDASCPLFGVCAPGHSCAGVINLFAVPSPLDTIEKGMHSACQVEGHECAWRNRHRR